MIDNDILAATKPGLKLLNFARDGIVDDLAISAALGSGQVAKYVTDFPTPALAGFDNVIAFPHLGASTIEAEENCAVMVVDLVKDFLENGNIRNAVNFPEAYMPRGSQFRLCVANRNVPKMLGQISNAMADAELNICDMLNQSKGELAYTIVDSDSPIPETVRQRIGAIEGVLNARLV
jgi:D-3-phosphoglycerate dehydrogenase